MLERASRSHVVIGLVSVMFLLGAFLAFFRTTEAVEPGTPEFQRTWERTDKPVKEGQVARTWMWAPEAFTGVMDEPYAESPGGTRQVQYFDKARMEINFPDAPDDGLWYVTNGLLVVEMISGQMQVGENSFETRGTSLVNVAGDPGDPNAPTYSSFISHLDRAPDRTGQAITQRIARDGAVSEDAALASQGVTAGYYDDVTGHNVANVFWDFMNSQGLVYENGQYIQDQLFINPFYATGRPITEPYFADVQVAGAVQTVLMQCFERRCMTYTPTNNTGFQVEAGNVGLHYFCWRYGYLPEGKGECIGSPVTPVPTVPGDNGGGNGTPPPGGDNGGPTATPDDTDPTATPPSGDDPGVDVDLNLSTVQLSVLGGGYNVPVYVANTGTQTDQVEVTLTKDAAISLCGPDSQTETITLNGGQSTILNFSQSCGVLSVDLAVEYTATATIARPPGASDTDTDDLLLVLDIGGGDDPTATSPAGTDPGVDVSLNLGTVQLNALGGSYNVPVRVTNTGSQTDTIQVSLSRTALLSLCTLNDTSKSVTLGGGDSTTVTFQETCGPLAGVQLLPTYTATGTINRSPGATDTDTDQLIISITVLPGDGGDDNPTPPSGNNPGVDVSLNLSTISVDASLLSGTTDPFNVPVQVTNTGSQTDSIRVQLSGSAALGTCSPSPTSRTISLAGGASTTVNFSQSCSGLLNLVGAQLLVTYTATGTIDRAPGASDTATDTQILTLNLLGGGGGGGGDNPPPSGDEADIEIVSVPSNQVISVGLTGGTINIPITIKNNGTETASGTVALDQQQVLATCSVEGTQSFTNLAPGATRTFTFSNNCLISLGLGLNYTVTATIPGDTDVETFSITLNVNLLGSAPTGGFMQDAA